MSFDNKPIEFILNTENNQLTFNYPVSTHDDASEEMAASDYHQQQIRALHRKIDILQKRLNDTKMFCDSLWGQLKDYE